MFSHMKRERNEYLRSLILEYYFKMDENAFIIYCEMLVYYASGFRH